MSGEVLGRRGGLLAVVLVLAALAAPAAGTLPLPKDLLGACKAAIEFADENSTFPSNGTTFCPTPMAFEVFARASGFLKWADLFAAAKAKPDAWRPYLRRLMLHARSDAYAPASAVTPRGVPALDSRLPVALDADGRATAYSQLRLSRGPFSTSRMAISFGPPGAIPTTLNRAWVVGPDALKTAGAVVHAVDRVVMPPDTYHSLALAARALRLYSSARTMRRILPQSFLRADTWATVILPTEAAWRAMLFKAPLPGWASNVTTLEINRNLALQKALMQYYTIALPAGDVRSPLDHATLARVWQLASGRNFVALPTNLTASNEQQMAYFTYDNALGKLYVVGARNMNAQNVAADNNAYMAASEVTSTTIYAGCSTALVTGGYLPLPLKTGLKKFDRPASDVTTNTRR